MKRITEGMLVWALGISFGLSIITLILYAYLGGYMRMIVDDFCTATIGLYYGAWDGFLYMYARWASNYSNFIIKYGLAPLQPELHPWLGLITVLGWYAAFYYCSLQSLNWIKAPNTKRLALILAGLLTFTIYRLLPNYQHAWWFAAAIPYTWSLIFFVFLIGAYLQYWRQEFSWPLCIAMFGFSASMVFFIGGFVELLLIVIIICLGYCALGTVWVKRERRLEWFLLLTVCGITALASLGISLLSPGAAVRRASLIMKSSIEQPTGPIDPYFDARQQLIAEAAAAEDVAGVSFVSAILPAIGYTNLYLFGEPFGAAFGQTVALGYLVFLLLFLILAAIFYLERWPEYRLPAPKSIAWAAIAVLVMGYLLTFAVLWAIYYSSSLILTRPLILSRLVQIAIFMAWAYLFIAAAQRNNWYGRLRRARTWPFLLLAVIFLLIWTPAVSIFKLLELQPQLSQFADSWDERHEYLLSQEGAETIYVEPFAYDVAELFSLGELATENDADAPLWYNECVANYYHIGKIYLKGDE